MNPYDSHALAEKYADLDHYNIRSRFWLFRKIEEFFKMERPPAATSREWREWRKYAKEKYPIKYFLYEDLERWTWWPIKHKLQYTYWWVKHRFHPKHRYHVIKPRTLEPGYYDARTLILHAQMDILADFYEHQKKYGHVDWEGDEDHSRIWKEIEAIYNWWIAHQDREKLLPEFPRHPEETKDDIFLGDETDNYPEYQVAMDIASAEYHRLECEWETQEEEMINRLAKIRLYLWD